MLTSASGSDGRRRRPRTRPMLLLGAGLCIALAVLIGVLVTSASSATAGAPAVSGSEAPASVLRAFYRHVVDGEPDRACALLTARARGATARELGRATCPEAVTRLGARIGGFQANVLRTMRVERTSIAGRWAVVVDGDVNVRHVASGDGRFMDGRPTVLVPEDGRWRIDDLG